MSRNCLRSTQLETAMLGGQVGDIGPDSAHVASSGYCAEHCPACNAGRKLDSTTPAPRPAHESEEKSNGG